MTPPGIALLAPETLFHERYRVIRCIKAGAMGAVYEVTDEVTGRHRALKVMLPGAIHDPELRARFAQEARITGNVESDHIVEVFDAGVDAASSTPFLVMDLLRGEELGSMSARRGPLPAVEVVVYLSQVAIALDKTHAAAIVHRDLKPDNLFVTSRDDGTPCVKILDFGVAKIVVQTSLVQRTAMVGTPLYMAPEQIRGDGRVGPSADIYALGHIAFGLLAGSPYWMTEAAVLPSIFALFHRILVGLPEAPSARAAQRGVLLPPTFDAWFQRAVAVNPEDRFGSATGAIAVLGEALCVAPGSTVVAPAAVQVQAPALEAPKPSVRGAPRRADRPPDPPARPAPAQPSAPKRAAAEPKIAAAEPKIAAAEPKIAAAEPKAAAAEPKAAAALKVVAANGDPLLGKCFPLTQTPTYVGRGKGNHIVLDHPAIAKVQAVLDRRSEGWVLRNYERPEREVPLQLGDRVKVGPFVLRLVDYVIETERYQESRPEPSFITVPLDMVLKDEFLRAREGAHGLSMLMFELEQIQRLEEVHGQAAVNRGLQHMGAVLERRLRENEPNGVLARHGRGTFAFLLPTKSRGWVRLFATLAFGEPKKYPLRISPSQEVRVDVRIGVAQLQQGDGSWRDMLERGLRELGSERISKPE